MKSDISLFEGRKIRKIWDDKAEKWWFSIVDVVAVLSQSDRPRKYWGDLKRRLSEEGSELSAKIGQFKMEAEDGKQRETDTADTETLLRIIQSIPSPNAEPFKLWLAKVGYERVQEMANPELSLNRARENWKKRGRSEKWIGRRMMGQETRNKLTGYWDEHGVQKGREFAILTNIIHEEWSGLPVRGHKDLKGLKRENLRDNMSEAELIFTALAEMSTREIADGMKAEGLEENRIPAKKGGGIAKNARKELEEKSGKKVVTERNFLPPRLPSDGSE